LVVELNAAAKFCRLAVDRRIAVKITLASSNHDAARKVEVGAFELQHRRRSSEHSNG
jgi:hypothetical protein